ncbi:hypothetical protein RND81_03G169800 [Saponaria officinalis]|uniref:Secreted protein n=1 Tax=Saponaria officinalis TaxID=3572 RepID=A0AAW1M6M3_SAPOF
MHPLTLVFFLCVAPTKTRSKYHRDHRLLSQPSFRFSLPLFFADRSSESQFLNLNLSNTNYHVTTTDHNHIIIIIVLRLPPSPCFASSVTVVRSHCRTLHFLSRISGHVPEFAPL